MPKSKWDTAVGPTINNVYNFYKIGKYENVVLCVKNTCGYNIMCTNIVHVLQ